MEHTESCPLKSWGVGHLSDVAATEATCAVLLLEIIVEHEEATKMAFAVLSFPPALSLL